MYIWKELTEAEKKHNKKNPQHEIKPHKAFYIDEESFPEEAQLWKALGYDNLVELMKEGKIKPKM